MRQVIIIKGQLISKKNSPRIVRFGNRASIRPSKAYDAWEKEAKPQLSSILPWSGDYPLAFGFFLFRRTNAVFDINNLGQGLQDVLEYAGIIDGDDMNHVLPYPIGAGWAKDKENPRSVIILEDYKESPLSNNNMDLLNKCILESN